MPALLPPSEAVRASFLAAVREVHAHPAPPPWFVADLDAGRLAPAFDAYVRDLHG